MYYEVELILYHEPIKQFNFIINMMKQLEQGQGGLKMFEN